MYNRVRSYNTYVPLVNSWQRTTLTHTVNIEPDPLYACTPSADVITEEGPFSGVYIDRYAAGTMSDVTSPPKSIGYHRRPRSSRPRYPLPVKPVSHVYKTLRPLAESREFSRFRAPTIGSCRYETTQTQIMTPMQFLCDYWTPEYVKTNMLDLIPSNPDARTFHGADWFSLMSEFNEGLDNLVPNSFFSGETLAEGGIFIDALKLIVNPKRAVLGFFLNVKKRHLHRHNLGELDLYYRNLIRKYTASDRSEVLSMGRDFGIPKSVLLEGTNAHLLYKFGVKPAIEDIRHTLSAHQKVDARLKDLSSFAGRYFPIRVRKTSSSEVYPYGSNPSPGSIRFVSHVSSQKCVSSIFGMGRVRLDINDASKWRPYAEYFGLNKIVGTAWELIPFTFVVDWFTNAQERINDLTRVRLGEGPFMNVTSIGHSIKQIVTTDIVLYPGFDAPYGTTLIAPHSPTPLCQVDTVRYIRSPGLPDTSGVIDLSTLGLFHAVTGGELIVQRIL
jgi:hypothetical protein